MSYEGSGTREVLIADSVQHDSFGRLRTAHSHILLDNQHDVHEAHLLWDQQLVGGATITHVPAQAAMYIAVTAAAGDLAIRQTKRYWRYRTGVGHGAEAGLGARARG